MEINGHIDSLVFHLVHDDNDRWLATHQGDSQKVVTVSALVNMFKLALAQTGTGHCHGKHRSAASWMAIANQRGNQSECIGNRFASLLEGKMLWDSTRKVV